MQKIKQLIQENTTIFFGLALPLCLVLGLCIFSFVASIATNPPEYDAVFMVKTYNNLNEASVNVEVENNKLKPSLVYPAKDKVVNPTLKPVIYIYNAKKKKMRKIGIPIPTIAQSVKEKEKNQGSVVALNAPELATITLAATSTLAPDGYEFLSTNSNYNRGIFPAILFYNHYDREIILQKNNYKWRISHDAYDDYYSGDVQFIGWCVSQ